MLTMTTSHSLQMNLLITYHCPQLLKLVTLAVPFSLPRLRKGPAMVSVTGIGYRMAAIARTRLMSLNQC